MMKDKDFELLRPSPGRIIVVMEKEEEVTETGIYLAVSKEKNKNIAIVISCGEKSADKGCNLSKGQKIIIRSWCGEEFIVKGKTYKIVSFDDVEAVFP